MPTELKFEHAKEIYSLAVNSQRSKNLVYAIRLFESAIEAADPFYTPFSLAGVSQCYAELGHRDLETATFKRVTQLPKQQQLLLNPGWLALTYQRSGDLRTAMDIHAEVLKLVPHEPQSTSALAEISLLAGSLDQAEVLAAELQKRAEPHFQILGRIIRAIALAVRNENEEAAKELVWVGQFMISIGSIPIRTWDYSDLQPLVPKSGPIANAIQILFDALNGRIALTEFIAKWAEIMPTLQTKS